MQLRSRLFPAVTLLIASVVSCATDEGAAPPSLPKDGGAGSGGSSGRGNAGTAGTSSTAGTAGTSSAAGTGAGGSGGASGGSGGATSGGSSGSAGNGGSGACNGRAQASLNDTQFDFQGTWMTSTGSGKHQADDHYSATPDSVAQVRFDGVRVDLHAARAPHHGMAEVSVDSGAP